VNAAPSLKYCGQRETGDLLGSAVLNSRIGTVYPRLADKICDVAKEESVAMKAIEVAGEELTSERRSCEIKRNTIKRDK
jgi:hypothetical protein